MRTAHGSESWTVSRRRSCSSICMRVAGRRLGNEPRGVAVRSFCFWLVPSCQPFFFYMLYPMENARRDGALGRCMGEMHGEVVRRGWTDVVAAGCIADAHCCLLHGCALRCPGCQCSSCSSERTWTFSFLVSRVPHPHRLVSVWPGSAGADLHDTSVCFMELAGGGGQAVPSKVPTSDAHCR